MSIIHEGVIDSQEQLQDIARRLLVSPLRDDHQRALHVRVSRLVNVASPSTRRHLCALATTLSKQVVMDDNGRFVLATQCVGRPQRWLSDDEWRHVFSAIGCRADVLPNPSDHGIILMLMSSKALTESQCLQAIAAAQAFGDDLGVQWPQPKQQHQEQHDE